MRNERGFVERGNFHLQDGSNRVILPFLLVIAASKGFSGAYNLFKSDMPPRETVMQVFDIIFGFIMSLILIKLMSNYNMLNERHIQRIVYNNVESDLMQNEQNQDIPVVSFSQLEEGPQGYMIDNRTLVRGETKIRTRQ